jgi:hypothetical protein
MSEISCSACGAANSPELLYCSACGAILEKSNPASSSSPTTSMARRRHQRIKADLPTAPSFFSRLKGLFFYLLWVALGVIVVLAVMEPKGIAPRDNPIPGAKGVLDQVITASRYSPSGVSQALANSLLAEQGAVTYDSPVRLIPMPIWDATRVDLLPGHVVLHTTVSLMGLKLRLSESFRLQGAPGAWSLVPESGSIGMLELGESLLPALTVLVRPPVTTFEKNLAAISAVKSLVIRPGIAEFTSR